MLGSAAQGVEEQGWGRACEVLGLQWAHVGPVWAGSGCWGELCRVLGSIWPWVGAGLAELLQVTLGLFCEAGLGSGVPGVGGQGRGGGGPVALLHMLAEGWLAGEVKDPDVPVRRVEHVLPGGCNCLQEDSSSVIRPAEGSVPDSVCKTLEHPVAPGQHCTGRGVQLLAGWAAEGHAGQCLLSSQLSPCAGHFLPPAVGMISGRHS